MHFVYRKILGDCLDRFAGSATCSYLRNLFGGKLGLRIGFSGQPHVEPRSHCVLLILGCGYPFEIAIMIVCFGAVPMIDLWLALGIGNEGAGHKNVCAVPREFTASTQGGVAITRAACILRKYSAGLAVVPVRRDAPHASVAGDLVIQFMVGNRFPDFIVHIRHGNTGRISKASE